jgi:hypothetical protein
MASNDLNRNRWRAAILVIAPAGLFGVLAAHAYLPGRLPNDAAVAEAVASGMTRWGLVHLFTGVASALIILAFVALRRHLREAGEDRFSARGLPYIIVGGTLFAMLPGMEFAPLAAAEIGATTAEIAEAQEALTPYFVPVLMGGALFFAIGASDFARALSRTRVLSDGLTRVVVIALVVMALSRFVPLAAVQFYVQGLAGIVALWPLAFGLRTQPAHHAVERSRTVPAG